MLLCWYFTVGACLWNFSSLGGISNGNREDSSFGIWLPFHRTSKNYIIKYRFLCIEVRFNPIQVSFKAILVVTIWPLNLYPDFFYYLRYIYSILLRLIDLKCANKLDQYIYIEFISYLFFNQLLFILMIFKVLKKFIRDLFPITSYTVFRLCLVDSLVSLFIVASSTFPLEIIPELSKILAVLVRHSEYQRATWLIPLLLLQYQGELILIL